MLLETFATTGANPNASSVGKVISEPDPTTALMAPAAIAAARIANISPLATWSPASADGRGVRHPAGGPALDDQRDAEAPGQIPRGEHLVQRARGEHSALAHEHGVGETLRHFLDVMRHQDKYRRGGMPDEPGGPAQHVPPAAEVAPSGRPLAHPRPPPRPHRPRLLPPLHLPP